MLHLQISRVPRGDDEQRPYRQPDVQGKARNRPVLRHRPGHQGARDQDWTPRGGEYTSTTGLFAIF